MANAVGEAKLRAPWNESPTRGRRLFDSSEGWPARLSLSPRQCEIARLVAKDLTNKEIAAVLEISVWTVATHLRSVFARLDIHSKAAMVARISERIVDFEPIPVYPDDRHHGPNCSKRGTETQIVPVDTTIPEAVSTRILRGDLGT